MKRFAGAVGFWIWPLTALADVPQVVADIPPVHALVARVMAGVGAPDVLLPPGTSPHVHAMRPSQASALQDAQIVFWVGPELTPWLERPLATLAGDARSVTLLHTEIGHVLPYRWGGHDHGGAEPGHDPDPAERDGHSGHGDHDDHAPDHAAGTPDPHAWMDPVVAGLWMGAIAAALSEADPVNAAIYAANATAGQAELAVLQETVQLQLEPLRDLRLIVYHDALQYFEARFGLTTVGAMTEGESAPGPRHLDALRAVSDGACIVLEPQTDPGLAEAVGGGSATVTVVDPQGRGIPTGAGYYPMLLQSVAASLLGCIVT